MFTAIGSLFKAIFQNKQLLFQFSKNDFKAKYAGSALGIVWAFLNPLVTVLTYWFVFSVVGLTRSGNQNYPFIVYLVTGMVPWFYFSDALLSTTNVFREYSYLVKKVVFQIQILPTVKILSNLYTHCFFILIGFVICGLNGFLPSIYAIQIIYYLICLIVFLSALTWFTAAIQPFLPDITQVIQLLLQTIMWSLPILWVPSGKWSAILKLDPLYYIVQGYRDAFVDHQWFFQHGKETLYFWAVTLLLFWGSSIIFKRLKPHFSDVL